MRAGTPGFMGIRLREAREVRGFTATALSEVVGVSKQAISQYENGPQTPSIDVLVKISDTLMLPMSYFFTQFQEGIDGPIFFRSLNAATKSARLKGVHKVSWAARIYSFLNGYLSFPKENIPKLCHSENPQLNAEEIEQLAVNARTFFKLGLGPISNLVQLLENNGVIVARTNLNSIHLDAASVFVSGIGGSVPLVMLNMDKQNPIRARSDTAHELGHLVLHSHVKASTFNHFDYFNSIELQAMRFGGAFLLPAEALAKELPKKVNLETLLVMKERWKVSVKLIIKRSEDLNLISSEYAKRLYANYSHRGWNRGEPGDERFKFESPQLMARGISLLLDKGILSRDDLLARLFLRAEDVEEITGLPEGFLSRNVTNIENFLKFREPHQDTGKAPTNAKIFRLGKDSDERP